MVARFSRRFAAVLRSDGFRALDEVDWADEFWALGFEMDCGRSYNETYGRTIGGFGKDTSGLPSVDDLLVLGNGVFSECRYVTHWAYMPTQDSIEWTIAALERMQELAESR